MLGDGMMEMLECGVLERGRGREGGICGVMEYGVEGSA